jgi:adenylosuccinate lyase
MPHKINPWKFENSDGNLVMANAILIAMADKLPISKLQRDLSDSTLLRNQGLALGYSVLALKSTLNGLSRLDVDLQKTKAELSGHWELLAEPIQVVLRKLAYKNPYEILKKFSRGENISKADFQNFINGLKIDKEIKEQLLELSPENYTGYAEQLVNQYINQ